MTNIAVIFPVLGGSGLTNSNYPELTKLYENYKEKGVSISRLLYHDVTWDCIVCMLSMSVLRAGLEILAFPCNQFGNQEPGSNEEIMQFACTRFKAEFPIFDKVVY